MAGYQRDFGSNVDYAYSRGARDIAGSLQRGLANISSTSSGLGRMATEARGARKSISELGDRMGDLRAAIAAATDPVQIMRLAREFDTVSRAAEGFRRRLRQMPFDALEKGLGRVTKGLVGMNAALLGVGFDFLATSIKRVYELQERWTRAIGGFNLRIGGMTAGLRGAQRAATSWSATIRGLTDGDINEGIQMFADFTDAIGRTVTSGDRFQRFGLQLARGFNMGGQGAGQLTRVLESIGNSTDEAQAMMGRLVKAANLASVPTNMLAKDIQESSVYLARFGKESEQAFVTGAAWVRKFTISMEQLRRSVEGLDMFDEAARTASKLNVAFGTMINSMDLMLEDDPAKRLEDIRQQFLAQGMTFDKLTPKQRRYLSETLKLTEDQTAALLSAQHAGESYAEFQEKAARRERADLSAKAMMQKQLQATAQTMYAFGAAFDRVTVAIANAIRPLLKVLGLAGRGDREFKSFGQVMESITTTVETFFNSLARNSRWNDWVGEIARDLQRAGSALRDFVMSGRAAGTVGSVTRVMKEFYVTVRDLGLKALPALQPLLDVFLTLSRHIKEIAVAWLSLKGFNMLGGINRVRDIIGGHGPTGPGRRAGGGIIGRASRAVGAAGAPGRVGMAVGAGVIGDVIGGGAAGIGAGIGSMAGGMFGPIGMVLGPIVGGLAGKAVEWIMGSTKVRSQIDMARADLETAMQKESARREALTGVLEVVTARQEAQDRTRKAKNDILRSMEETAARQKGKVITLNEMEVSMLRERADELTMFGRNIVQNRRLLDSLAVGTKLTKEQLTSLVSGSEAYEMELSKLRDTTKQQADIEMSRLQISSIGQQKDALEMTTKLREAELKVAKQQLAEMGGNVARGTSRLDRLAPGASADMLLQAAETAGSILNQMGGLTRDERKRLEMEARIDRLSMDNVTDQRKLIGLQTDFLRQQTVIELRRAVMSDANFLSFQRSAGQVGRTLDQQLIDFVNSGHSALANDPYALSLLREGSSLQSIASGTRVQAGPARTPSRPSIPAELNLVRPTTSSSRPDVKANVNVTLNVDGQKLMGVVVGQAIRGRE